MGLCVRRTVPHFLIFGGADLWRAGRFMHGWRVNDWFYVGPEAQAFACLGFTQGRLGAHLTALKTEDYEWSAAAGWSQDSDHRSGLYLRLGLLTRR